MCDVVCVPWRPGDPSRELIFGFLARRWVALGFRVVTGDNEQERFGAARSRNLAARAAGDWDAALFVDADVFLGAGQAEAALALARSTGQYVAAYTALRWLDETATARVIFGDDPTPDDAYESTSAWLGAFAVRRDLWDDLGGFNEERFPGVGGEDVSFFACATVNAPPLRVPGDVYHLHHTPRPSRWT